jgi:hypothetical protein
MKDLQFSQLAQVSGGGDYDDNHEPDCNELPDPEHKKCYIVSWQELCLFENDIPCLKV